MTTSELAEAARAINADLDRAASQFLDGAEAIHETWKRFGPERRQQFYLWFESEILGNDGVTAAHNPRTCNQCRLADDYVLIAKHRNLLTDHLVNSAGSIQQLARWLRQIVSAIP